MEIEIFKIPPVVLEILAITVGPIIFQATPGTSASLHGKKKLQ
jgi:hypothetical protein